MLGILSLVIQSIKQNRKMVSESSKISKHMTTITVELPTKYEGNLEVKEKFMMKILSSFNIWKNY